MYKITQISRTLYKNMLCLCVWHHTFLIKNRPANGNVTYIGVSCSPNWLTRFVTFCVYVRGRAHSYVETTFHELLQSSILLFYSLHRKMSQMYNGNKDLRVPAYILHYSCVTLCINYRSCKAISYSTMASV